MRNAKLASLILIMSLLLPALLCADDFSWCAELNRQASANPNNYRLSLAERFKLTDEQVHLVLENAAQPSDAYMLLRLGEIAHQPPERLVTQYQADKNQGWGVMAQHLGVKPGSAEFHALKRGHDLRDYRPAGQSRLRQDQAPSTKFKSARKAKPDKTAKPNRPGAIKPHHRSDYSHHQQGQGSRQQHHADQRHDQQKRHDDQHHDQQQLPTEPGATSPQP